MRHASIRHLHGSNESDSLQRAGATTPSYARAYRAHLSPVYRCNYPVQISNDTPEGLVGETSAAPWISESSDSEKAADLQLPVKGKNRQCSDHVRFTIRVTLCSYERVEALTGMP
jgi:hypothetical protein